MVRNILVLGNVVYVIEMSETDKHAIPKDASRFTEEFWQSLIGESPKDENGNDLKTFDAMEDEYIKSRGWINGKYPENIS